MLLKQKLQDFLNTVSGTFGVAVKNLVTGETVYINAKHKFQSASTCKVAILATLLQEVQLGKIALEKRLKVTDRDLVPGSGVIQKFDMDVELSVKDLATMMIIVSDNLATDKILELIGKEKVNRFMNEAGLEDSRIVHSIWELLSLYTGIEPKEKNLQNYMELTQRLENTSDNPESTVFDNNHENNWFTAYDMNLLLEQIAMKTIISDQLSELALNIMKSQQFRNRIPYLLPNDLDVACKSGTLGNVINDAGIVYSPNKKPWFIISVFSQNTTKIEGETTIAKLAKISYEHFLNG